MVRTGDGLVTYNFDPERWYENERSAIEAQYGSGHLTANQYNDAIDNLQRRYDEMMDRLDGTYQIPNSTRWD
jgi:hypothetical protein